MNPPYPNAYANAPHEITEYIQQKVQNSAKWNPFFSDYQIWDTYFKTEGVVFKPKVNGSYADTKAHHGKNSPSMCASKYIDRGPWSLAFMWSRSRSDRSISLAMCQNARRRRQKLIGGLARQPNRGGCRYSLVVHSHHRLLVKDSRYVRSTHIKYL